MIIFISSFIGLFTQVFVFTKTLFLVYAWDVLMHSMLVQKRSRSIGVNVHLPYHCDIVMISSITAVVIRDIADTSFGLVCMMVHFSLSFCSMSNSSIRSMMIMDVCTLLV